MTVFQVALCDNLEAETETHLMEVDLEAAVVTAAVLVVDVEVDEAEVREKKRTPTLVFLCIIALTLNFVHRWRPRRPWRRWIHVICK